MVSNHILVSNQSILVIETRWHKFKVNNKIPFIILVTKLFNESVR